jgi:hypothetical protein
MVETTQIQPPKSLYAGRLRDLDASLLKTVGVAEAYDESTQQPVIVALEPKRDGQHLPALAAVEHAHLARIVAVVDQSESWLVLSQVIRGTKLRCRVAELGRKHAVDAVRTALRVADALDHLHDAWLTHGRVNPDNVLLCLESGVEPVLVYGARSSGSYCRPERTSDDLPLDSRDDTWAATALLFLMLSGKPPPINGLSDAQALDDLSIEDPLLREVLLHGLAADESQRAKDLTSLRRELARWFITHAADEPLPLSGGSHIPPPLPAWARAKARLSFLQRGHRDRAPAVALRLRGWLRSLPIAAVAAIVGLGGSWGVLHGRKASTRAEFVRERVSPASVPSATPSSEAIDLAEVPVMGKEQSSGDPTASCARSFLRDGTLSKSAQLELICVDGDLPRALGALRLAFSSTTGPAPASVARFDNLGWYSLALLATLRKSCCTDPPPLNLADIGEACKDLAGSLDELGNAISAAQQFESAVQKFTRAARCAVRTGRAAGLPPSAPSPAMEKSFRELFAFTSSQ